MYSCRKRRSVFPPALEWCRVFARGEQRKWRGCASEHKRGVSCSTTFLTHLARIPFGLRRRRRWNAQQPRKELGWSFHRKLWFCECRLDYSRASNRCLISGISARQPRILASSSFENISGMKEREMKLFGCRWSFWNFATNLAGSSSGYYWTNERYTADTIVSLSLSLSLSPFSVPLSLPLLCPSLSPSSLSLSLCLLFALARFLPWSSDHRLLMLK